MKTNARFGLLVGLCFGLSLPYLMAARNGSGTYSLPNTGSIPNPVVTGTTISSTWANGTLSDIATELTDSLSRTGKGGMSAPLVCTAGTIAAPSLTFAGNTDTGLLSLADGGIAMSLVGAAGAYFTTAQTSFFQTVATVAYAGTNSPGLSGIGDGTAAGVQGTGGSSDGIGVKGTGGATNGAGGQFTGASPGGYGAVANGMGDSYAGLRALHNSTTTSTARYNAIEVTQDDIVFTSVVDPAFDAGFTNRLAAANVPKAWATVQAGAATPTLLEAFNIQSASCTANRVLLTVAGGALNESSPGFVTLIGGGTAHSCFSTASTSSVYEVGCSDASGSAINLCSVAINFSFLAFGNQ